jgi:crotonobetainyl-CoA:carnitine CoA-transferase CaiB-like acyl-CoA transferase
MNALEGLKVLELGQLIAGPFAGKTLAEFGADVIKVEPAGVGDPLRKWRLLRDGTSVWWEVQSRNKRSVCLDLRSTEGQEAVRALALEADVLIENFKPGTLEGWGLVSCPVNSPALKLHAFEAFLEMSHAERTHAHQQHRTHGS